MSSCNANALQVRLNRVGLFVMRELDTKLKGLILAQNERWRRGLGMQVEREPRKGGQRQTG